MRDRELFSGIRIPHRLVIPTHPFIHIVILLTSPYQWGADGVINIMACAITTGPSERRKTNSAHVTSSEVITVCLQLFGSLVPHRLIDIRAYEAIWDTLALLSLTTCDLFAMAPPDVEGLLQALTLEQKLSLLAGASQWRTMAIPSLGFPALKVRTLSVRNINRC